MVDEVVVVKAVVHGVDGQAVEEGTLVLSLTHDERDLGEPGREKKVYERNLCGFIAAILSYLPCARSSSGLSGRTRPSTTGANHL